MIVVIASSLFPELLLAKFSLYADESRRKVLFRKEIDPSQPLIRHLRRSRNTYEPQRPSLSTVKHCDCFDSISYTKPPYAL